MISIISLSLDALSLLIHLYITMQHHQKSRITTDLQPAMLTKHCININILKHTKMALIFYMNKTETQGLVDYNCPVYRIKAQMRKNR